MDASQIKWDTPSSGIVWDDEKQKPDAYAQTAKTDTNLQNLAAAMGGAMYAPVLGAKQAFGKATPQEVGDWKQAMSGLWSTPMGKVGTVAGGAVTAAPLAFLPGANTVAGSALGGLAYGAAQPVGEDTSRMAQAVEGMGGGVAGKYAGDVLGKVARNMFAGKSADLANAQAANAVRDATLAETKGAGYVIPPVQANPQSPGALNRMMEGLSGKIQTAQAASIKNQPVTDALAKRALGLPDSVPLTPDTLQSVRKVAGTAYTELKKFGPVQADQQFGSDMQTVVGEYMSLAKNFPSQKNGAIDALISDLDKPTFASADAVELVKRLRHDGFKNVASQDPAAATLGKIQIGAQNAIEDLIDRNLAASGNADFLQVFRNARTTIAKSHTIENALEESTGKVVASKIGREFSKGRPLTGELATIGKTAQAFPKAVQNVNTSMPGLSPLDAMGSLAALIGAVGTGNPNAAWLAAAPLARPVVRAGLLSKPWQSGMVRAPSYEVGLLGTGAKDVLNSDATMRLLQSIGMSMPSM